MSSAATVAVARHAMATRFEIVLHGDDPMRLRAAGEEALDEIVRIERQLSLYLPTSEIARINAHAASEPVRVSPALLRLLQQIEALSTATDGAFDITVGPLMRCWGFMNTDAALPDPASVERARHSVGMQHVALDAARQTVRFQQPDMMLDLGAVGKGFAIEIAVGALREAGITSAIIHGGTSTIYGLGRPPDKDAWNVALEYPPHLDGTPGGLLSVVPLCNEALSVSAVWGKSFQVGAATYGHVLDPRTGYPASSTLLAAVALPSPTETDALSTGLLVAGAAAVEKFQVLRPALRALALGNGDASAPFKVATSGFRVV